MKFEFYKKGQGYYTRLCTALGGGVLAALGSYALYAKLEGVSWGGEQAGRWFQAGIPVFLFLALAFAVYKLVNYPKLADFMIQTEGEMKKVSWSTKKEVLASTRVVVITVITMAILLAVVDFGFTWLFQILKIIPKIT